MKFLSLRHALLFGAAASTLANPAFAQPAAVSPAATVKPAVATIPGMPPVPDPANLYSEQTMNKVLPSIASDLQRVYVPHIQSNDVYVIDPSTLKVVDKYRVGLNPHHIVPAWDMKTLWVANTAENTKKGSVMPIDPKTGKVGKAIPVEDPYNLYFSPDGKSAVVVAEAYKRLDFRDPQTMAMQSSLSLPECAGVNHADFSIDGRYAIFTCEFAQSLVKIDWAERKVLGYLKLSRGGMPQDIRVSPDGKRFYVADMMADGIFVIDGDAFKEIDFIRTGKGTHGLYPSRDGKKLYVANRGSNKIHGPAKGPGGVTVVDFATGKVEANWLIPGGGSPDMGNVSADGTKLWLSGRYDNVVYVFDTTTGEVKSIPVGREPHGLTVWPQPGRYSLGHTGNMR